MWAHALFGSHLAIECSHRYARRMSEGQGVIAMANARGRRVGVIRLAAVAVVALSLGIVPGCSSEDGGSGGRNNSETDLESPTSGDLSDDSPSAYEDGYDAGYSQGEFEASNGFDVTEYCESDDPIYCEGWDAGYLEAYGSGIADSSDEFSDYLSDVEDELSDIQSEIEDDIAELESELERELSDLEYELSN